MNTRPTPGPASRCVTVGVISDTHGRLYAPVKQLLQGVDHIVHAGDIGSAQVLAELKSIAPVTAVRGNCDYEAWARALPVRAELELGGARILVGHIPSHVREWADRARRAGEEAGFAVLIAGHSHLAAIEEHDGILSLNPGSAGPKRFERPRTIARLTIRPAPPEEGGAPVRVEAEILPVAGG